MPKKKRPHKRPIILILAIITTLCAVALAFKVVPHQIDIIKFRQEQAALTKINPHDAYMLEINPDYVGWLMIEGSTAINFPVVRGNDNEKYLNTTFSGEQNKLGAIFMDYRSEVDAPHIIIYGHQVRITDGEMYLFGGLFEYLDDRYLKEHQIISYMENENMYQFEVFSARMTDIYDPAYFLNFSAPGSFEAFLERNGAPNDVAKIITLSTCVGDDNDMRLIVQGALRDVFPAAFEYDEIYGWGIVVHDVLP
jgi:sortase B